jgi:DNA-binding MarR family transcriptional regulator|tara:strand:- start:70 stop:396 length:327 start_codon:yes stop_codon:yes gene_type:complete
MSSEIFLLNKSLKKANDLCFSHGIAAAELIVLSEISVRSSLKEECPNVKWLQTELQISFTKVKAILDPLELQGYIIKKISPVDHRVRTLHLTDKGDAFILKVACELLT